MGCDITRIKVFGELNNSLCLHWVNGNWKVSDGGRNFPLFGYRSRRKEVLHRVECSEREWDLGLKLGKETN